MAIVVADWIRIGRCPTDEEGETTTESMHHGLADRAPALPADEAQDIQASLFYVRRHDVLIWVGSMGGARGWALRSKVSTMIIRPPQHGHGCANAAGFQAGG